MSTTTDTGDTPIIDTRIPEHRSVPGLQYGAHVSRPGWTGYYVNATGSRWVIARQTPADDELVGDDWAILGAIIREVEALETTAERVARAFGNDGQRFEHPVSGDTLDDFCRAEGARVEGVRRYDDGTHDLIGMHAVTTADPVRYVFDDGSVIVVHADAWDFEGDTPGSWRG